MLTASKFSTIITQLLTVHIHFGLYCQLAFLHWQKKTRIIQANIILRGVKEVEDVVVKVNMWLGDRMDEYVNEHEDRQMDNSPSLLICSHCRLCRNMDEHLGPLGLGFTIHQRLSGHKTPNWSKGNVGIVKRVCSAFCKFSPDFSYFSIRRLEVLVSYIFTA